MRKLLTIVIAMFALIISTEEQIVEENLTAHMLLSTYEIAAGSSLRTLEKDLLKNVKDEEGRGFNDCGLYRHQFGGQRAFYQYCYFSDFEHFAKIMEAETIVNPNERQIFSSHSDHILNTLERNLTAAPNYLLFTEYQFDSALTNNGKTEQAEEIFAVYNEAFGGCNLYQHYWGPEQAYYFSCGYSDYRDFANKTKQVSELMSSTLGNKSLHISSHSDDLLVLIQD